MLIKYTKMGSEKSGLVSYIKGDFVMKMGLFLAVIIIVILEILRYFRDTKRTITEIHELKSRVEYLENTMKQK